MSSKNFYGLTGDVTIDGGILNVANTNVSGNVTSTSLLVSNVATLGTTKTFVVRASGGAYYIDEEARKSLELHEGQTYIFDLSHSSLASGPHPLEFATQPEGANNSGYTTGISSTGTLGTTGAKKTFVVPAGAPTTLYYYCTVHSGMGGQINISPAAELVVSGRIVASGNVEASKITASANVEVTGNVVASKFVGDGSLLTSVTAATTSGLQVVTDNSPTTTNTIEFTNPTTSLRASSNIVATGNVTADHFIGDGSRLSGIVTSVTFGDAVDTGNVSSNTLLLTNAKEGLVATGNVVTQGKFIGDGSELTGIVTSVNLSDAVDTGNTTSNTVQFTNTSTSLTASGNVEVAGNVVATYFVGDGSRLTGLPSGGGGSGTSHWTKDAVTNQLHYSTGSVGISNTNPAQAHDLSVGSNLYVDDDATDGVLMVTGNVHGTYFVGDGSRLINLPEGGGSTNWTTSGNPVNKIYYPQNPGTTSVSVGIMNAAPTHTLSVGSNLFIDDAGSNVLHVDGNITAESMFLGALGIKPAYPLDSVTDTGNVTPHTISFTNPTLGITTASNVEIGGALVVGKGTLGGSNLEVGEANLFVNTQLTRVGIATDQPAATLHVNGSLAVDGPLTFGTVDVAAQHGLEAITAVDNTTPLTIELQNADTSLITTGNVEVGGNVITSKDLTVSGNVEVDGGIVSNVNLLSVSNVASIKKDSNVVTEFPRSKKLIKYPRVNLTQNAETNGYAAEASTENDGTSTGQAYRVFDGNVNGERGYHSAAAMYTSGSTYNGTASITDVHGTPHQGEWIKLQMPTTEKMKLSGFSFSPRYVSTAEYSHRVPYKGVFLGSTDGTNWYPIHYFDNVTVPELTTVSRTFENNTTDYYNHIALVAYEIGPNATYGDVLNFAEMELFGTPEYDPEAHGTDVKVTSYPNVPNTDWLEVYHDAKDLEDAPVSTAAGDITGLGGTTNNGTAYGNPQISNGAFVLDGTGDYISTPVNADLSNHTASMWIVFDNPSTWETVYYLGPASGLTGENNIVVHVHSDNYFRIESSGRSFDVEYYFVPGKWVHMTVLFRGASGLQNLEVYIDNVKLLPRGTSTNPTASYSITGSNNLIIGSTNGGGYPLEGKIANFRLFNRILTTDEIYQLYAYQKEYFGYGDLSMTLKAGRLGIGTSEPRSLLQVGDEPFGPGSRPMFRAVNNSSSSLAYDATQGTKIFTTEFDTAQINVTNSYNTSTGMFTAPIPGYYFFEFQLLIAVPVANWGTVQLSLYKNGVSVNQAVSTRGLSYYWVNNVDPGPDNYSHLNTPSCRAILYLNRGDHVQAGYPGVGSSTASTAFEYSKNYAFFQGYLLST